MDDLTRLANAVRRADKRADEIRAEFFAAVYAALDAGQTQADIARATGYTRERLRQIAAKRKP